jgi:hypothetical protein
MKRWLLFLLTLLFLALAACGDDDLPPPVGSDAPTLPDAGVDGAAPDSGAPDTGGVG